MEAKEYYHAAVYLRLSRDDGSAGDRKAGGKPESNSIGSQREMIRSFVKNEQNMEIYDEYADDGWSGTNFDRPEFKRMMEDIRAGHVDCVIVKDLSRLGRDYIEVGRLIQKTFPAFSVRFIALTDHFDSLTADYHETSLVVPVKNFVNDSYARDISAKVRSHQKIKRENGEFIGAFAVYGYKKSEENRNRLVPDEYAAGVVRSIFAWKLEGYSNLAIAKKLDDLGVLPPMEYKRLRGERLQTGFVTGVKAGWSAVAIKRILINETYIGTLVQGKEEKVNYKVRKSVKKPSEEWTRVKGAHEAVISEEDFRNVQELLRVDTRAKKGDKKAHMYAGILFCGDCGEPMLRRVNRYQGKEHVFFICAAGNRGGGCTRHAVPVELLDGLVLDALCRHISLFMDKERVLARMERTEVCFEELASVEREIGRLQQEQEKYISLCAGLYEDLKKEVISEADFKNFRAIYETRALALQRAVRRQRDAVQSLRKSGADAVRSLEHMKAALQLAELDRMTLLTFVKRIEVYRDKRVSLEFRYRESFSEAVIPYARERHCGGEAV